MKTARQALELKGTRMGDKLEISYAVILMILGACRCQAGQLVWAYHFSVGIEFKDWQIGTVVTSSPTHCTVECYMRKDCLFAGYVPVTGACLLYSQSLYQANGTSLIPTTYQIQYYAQMCPPDFVTMGTYSSELEGCVLRTSGRYTFDDAIDFCRTYDADLPYVRTQAELDYFFNGGENVEENFWIGAYRDHNDSSVWRWLTGEVIDNFNGGQFWNKFRPTTDPTKACAFLNHVQNHGDFGFRDRECDQERRLVCVRYI